MPTTDMSYSPAEYWPRLVSGDGSLANVGQAALGDYNRHAYPIRLEAFDRALRAVPVQGARVFEAGYGEGAYLTEWGRRGAAHVGGLDLSPRAAAAGRQRFPGYDLRAGDLTQAQDFRGFGKYDIVTAIDVLYHIVDDGAWTRAMNNLLGLVRPGGWFLFSDKFPERGAWQAFPHVRRRSLALWDARLAPHGLSVVGRIPVFALMDDPIPTGCHPGFARFARLQWRLLTKPIRLTRPGTRSHRTLAAIVAGLQRPIERLLVRTLRRTPNTELVIARRAMPILPGY